ncbi:MAG TPA: universal stress protein [Bacteroidia bacterium]|nr:universal stress protein [Bacteroidia bacterium]HNR49210.1 universal stress protein [Bacteroidia bacterium]HNT82926.1 universal stress protein [Bacteroidia bacterium]
MNQEKKIIISPIDFSEQSLIALEQSYNLARLTGSDLRLLYVIDQDFITHLTNAIFSKENYADQVRNDIERRLDELATKIKKEQGIITSTHIRTGKIYEEIINEAYDTDAAFIVMGTQGASTLRKKFLGSNTSRVIREALCPVITIKGHSHYKGCKHIALPLDLTKETREKVNYAIDFAKLFGSTIHVFSVLETNDEFHVNKLERQLQQVKSFISDAGITCTGELIEEKDGVSMTIIEYAGKKECDLIVIMTQNETNITDLFIGTAAQEVINNSEIPVLCIRPMVRKDLTQSVLS